MKTIVFGALTLVIASSVAGGGQIVTGNDLIGDCRHLVDLSEGRHTDNEGAMACLHWMVGFERGVYASRLAAQQKPAICIPEGVTMAQMARVIVKHAKEHPELLHDTAALPAWNALASTFPCQQGEAKE